MTVVTIVGHFNFNGFDNTAAFDTGSRAASRITSRSSLHRSGFCSPLIIQDALHIPLSESYFFSTRKESCRFLSILTCGMARNASIGAPLPAF